MSFEPGELIAGKYRVERTIGQGGMGVVLAARHLGLDEMVAVKLIRAERVGASDALARFEREARAVARLKSEHVARVFDVDRLPEGDPYMVMELIDGADLHAIVKERGALPPHEAAELIMQACEGLAEAHALGMVHRDLKLKNLFLTQRRDGRPLVKVIDFGVVKILNGTSDDSATRINHEEVTTPNVGVDEAQLTGTSMLVGSVHYMAPEQIRASNNVDSRADVWSLGVCLFALLTNQLPFDGKSLIEICAAIQARPVPDVRTHVPSIPPELAAIVTRALEKDVRRRYADVGELALALTPFSRDHAAVARIATILESATGTSSGVSKGPSRVTAAPAVTAVLDAPGESTMDAAAIGSLVSRRPDAQPSTAKNRWLMAGALASLAVAIATVTLYRRAVTAEPTGHVTPIVATAVPAPETPALPPHAQPPIPTGIALSPPPVYVDPSAVPVLPPSTPTAQPPPPAAHAPKRPPPPAPRRPPPAPKPESTAYDKF